MVPDIAVVYDKKDELMKAGTNEVITLSNYDEWLMLYIDNELTTSQKITVEKFIASHPAINPAAPSSGPLCVIRGGDSSGPATFCRSTFRGVYAPSSAVFSIGFRAALTVDAVKESLKWR